jgi:hypothetical protein
MMINPMMLMQVRQFMQNPQQAIQQMGIPAEYQNNPQGMIQKLMDSGKLSQTQYNQLQQTARQIQGMINGGN